MTAHVQQHVVPRRRSSTARTSYSATTGQWYHRPLRTQRQWRHSWHMLSQQGSVTQSTVTLGLSLLALGVVVLLGFFYLQQVFGTATHGTDIQALESEISELREQQRALELEGAELRSMQAVEQRVKHINLVAIDHVAYLADTTDKVAVVAR